VELGGNFVDETRAGGIPISRDLVATLNQRTLDLRMRLSLIRASLAQSADVPAERRRESLAFIKILLAGRLQRTRAVFPRNTSVTRLVSAAGRGRIARVTYSYAHSVTRRPNCVIDSVLSTTLDHCAFINSSPPDGLKPSLRRLGTPRRPFATSRVNSR